MTTPEPEPRTDVERVLAAVNAGHQTSSAIATAAGIGQDAACVHLLALKTRGKVTRDESTGRPFKYKPATSTPAP
jgi:hypothetical protein